MSTNSDWLDIPSLEFFIRGVDGSSIHFASKAVLNKQVFSMGVVSFDATLVLQTPHSTFQHSFQFADYNGVRPFRNALAALRDGADANASMAGEGFSLTIGSYQSKIHESLLVEGYCSSIHDLNDSPWPIRRPVGELVSLESNSVGCIRFAFPSALVDPPYVNDAIAGIDSILQFLEGEGFQT